MTQENPYAPPAVAETETVSSRYWRLDGIGVILKNGATLPKVDLDSGVSEGEETLRSIQCIHQNAGIGLVISLVIPYFLIIVLSSYFEISSTSLFVSVIAGSLLLTRVMNLRGSQSSRIVIWFFTEERRAKRATIRRNIRIGTLVLLLAGLLVRMLAPVGSSPFGFFKLYLVWLGCMVALAIWALFDRPKYKIRAAESGWLQISPIHPKALEFLSRIEAEELQQQDSSGQPPKRLVQTIYLHRYPLRVLIGSYHRNPLMILQIALLKLFRSRLLVREAYHHSEAEAVTMDQLCTPLREACENWLTAHDGWAFVSGERLPSPAGDLIVETAYIAAPGLEHYLRIMRAWLQHTPKKAELHLTFTTWIDDGSEHISTMDQPFITLKNPQFHHRAKGGPEAVYQAQLGHIAGFNIHRPQDVSALLRLLQTDKEESNRLMVERKLHSEVRETEC
jgi:hypothetical protein